MLTENAKFVLTRSTNFKAPRKEVMNSNLTVTEIAPSEMNVLVAFPQMCMLLDIFRGSRILSEWTSIYLALPIFASSAVNPWVYGYRNSEVRTSVQRVMEELLGRLGYVPSHYGCPDLLAATNADQAELNSFASHVRLCAVSPNRTTLLLIPATRQDTAEGSTGVTTVKETVVHLELPPEVQANEEKAVM